MQSSVRVAAVIVKDDALALIERRIERPSGLEVYYLFPGGKRCKLQIFRFFEPLE